MIERCEAREMLAYRHSEFSVNAGVRIEAQDRAGLERLLRYWARPPFALDRLRQRGAELVYHCPKPQSGGKRADLVLSPLELIGRIAALVPLPRTHRHRYYGVLAPNSPLRAAVTATAQAAPAQIALGQRGPPLWDECDAQGADGAGQGGQIEPDPDWGESTQMTPD